MCVVSGTLSFYTSFTFQAYFGGEAHCAEQVSASDDYDPSELVCPPCSNVGGAMQVYEKQVLCFQ